MLKHFSKNIKLYASLPEMRLFWVFLVIAAVILAITFFNLPANLAYAVLGLIIFLGLVVFFAGLRLTTSNLEVKIERNEMKSIIQNLRDGIIAYDTNFKILVFNKAAEEIFGVPTEKVLGHAFSLDFAGKLQSKMLMQAMFPSLAESSVNKTEPASNVQVVDISFDNPEVELRVTTARIIDPGGNLLGFVKIIRDRTREVAILKSKSAFITVAAHQLRTPVNAIQWTMETLTKEDGLSAEGKLFIENGLKASTNLSQIVNDLLDVAKIEEGRFGYQFGEIDLVAFAEEVLKGVSSEALEYGINIYFDKPGDELVNIVADRERLQLAITNMLDNAIKYNVKNGSVTLGIKKLSDSPFVEIKIEDTGIGIPEENLSKLFTKFFRGENVLKIQTEGSGLGLYIAKNIIKRHGGDIKVESELNRGTAFYFTLPLDPALIPKKEEVFD